MIQAYLALLRSDQGPEREQRELILQTVFRPAQSGVVKDDIAPPFIWEWIAKGRKSDT